MIVVWLVILFSQVAEQTVYQIRSRSLANNAPNKTFDGGYLFENALKRNGFLLLNEFDDDDWDL
jgi:hypothetical protein